MGIHLRYKLLTEKTLFITKPFRYLLLLLLVIIFPTYSHADSLHIKSLNEVVPLSSNWLFKIGDDAQWAQANYDDSQWSAIKVNQSWTSQGYEGYVGMAWYRISLKFDVTKLDINKLRYNVFLYSNRVQSSHQIYAGGQLIGGLGGMPPLEKIEYGKRLLLEIPADAIDDEGNLVIAVRVWRSPIMNRFWSAGLSGAEPWLVGYGIDIATVHRFGDLSILVIAAMYLLIGLYHLYMYRRNREAKVYLWFGLCTIDMAIYAILKGQWSFSLGIPYMLAKQIEYIAIFLQAPLAMATVGMLLDMKFARLFVWIARCFYVLAALVLVKPTFSMLVPVLSIWQNLVVVLYAGITIALVWVAIRRESEIKIVAVGAMISTSCAIVAVLSENEVLLTPNMILFGYSAFMLTIVVCLANRITLLLSHLEVEVENRTVDLSQVNEKLEAVVRTDHLTGIANRRSFQESLSRAVGSYNSAKPFSIALADIDYFKQINDSYGHNFGDKVLTDIAQFLSAQARSVDTVARWGGEEFIFLLEKTDGNEAAVVIEKIRREMEALVFEYGRDKLVASITFGICQYDGESIETCIQNADKALYLGKNSGRNKVVKCDEAELSATDPSA